jgi:beta-lactamase regulating signal transducer with metallopeptidase domain
MTSAVCLLLYSVVVVVLGPPLLSSLTKGGRAPRFGVATWLIAIGSVLLTWLTVAILMVFDVIAHRRQGGSIVAACFQLLCDIAAGKAGALPQTMLIAGTAGVVGFAGAVAVRLARTLGRLQAQAQGHAQSVRLVGRPTAERDVYIMDSTERTAYCVSGKPPAIVVTSAAVAALDDRELGAVLAHERAHLDGHHPRIVTALRGLATVFPWLALITRGSAEVSRLLEMCADDAAARRYGHRALLTGLMALAGGSPAAALGAADIAVLNRAQRLADPPAYRARFGAQAALAGASTVIACAPVATLVLGVSGVLMCGG